MRGAMQKYSYKALTRDGRVVKGTLAATDDEDFSKVIADKGLQVYWFNTTGKKDKSKSKPLDLVTLMTFCRQLSSMLTAGLPLSKSIEMLYERSDKPKMKNALAALFEGVQKGNSLAESMITMGSTFPSLLISMIKSGEMSGQLEQTLDRMAVYYEKQRKQESQIKSALSYPKMLGAILIIVAAALIQFILPKMVAVLPEGTAVPKITQFLLDIKNFVVKNFFIIIAFVMLVYVMLPILRRSPKIDLFLEQLKLKLPAVGSMNRMIYTSRFASNLSTLCASGVHLLEAISMSSEMVGNRYVQKQLESSIEAIRRGESISASLQNVDGFDPMLMTMIFVGEESGSLEDILDQTANYFEGEAAEAIKGMTSLINPAMTVIMAVVIGVVLIGILAPEFALYNAY
ncbi:MAG: type II secretion system F family protein [Eubacteriales bacterium]|nr:type II secretion system F family protein [Eubacteriales bacterium]